MLLYSYIFDKVYKWYVKSKDNTPSLYAVLVITVLQAFTVMGVILLPIRLNNQKSSFPNWGIFVIALVVIGLNYIYFNKINTPEKIADKINSLSGSKTHLLQILMWVHIVVTVGLFILLVNLP
jgi:hypothetical protein